LASATTPIVPAPVSAASASRRGWRRLSWRMAIAAGHSSSARVAATASRASIACGSRRLAPTASICTPVAVAPASRPIAATTTIPSTASTHRSRSIGLRIRRAR